MISVLCRIMLAASVLLPVCALACTQEAPAVPYKVIELQKGAFSFPLKPSKEDADGYDYFKPYCPDNVCSCNADVSYVRFSDEKGQGIRNINDQLIKSADKSLCILGISDSEAKPEVTWDTSDIVSLKVTGYSMGTGGGGSCHGQNEMHTYNVMTGKEYLLKDVVDATKLKQIRAALAYSIFQKAEEYEKSLNNAFSMVKDRIDKIPDNDFLNFGFYIEDGKVFVNTNKYYFSCAGGNFNPGEIPPEFIQKDMLAELDINKKKCN